MNFDVHVGTHWIANSIIKFLDLIDKGKEITVGLTESNILSFQCS